MMTRDEVLQEAVGTLAGWIQGYTDSDETGRQYRIRTYDNDNGDESSLLVGVEEIGEYGRRSDPTFFRIKIEVTEESGDG